MHTLRPKCFIFHVWIYNVFIINAHTLNTLKSPGNYGSSLMEVFKGIAQDEGICIANTESVAHNAEEFKFDEIVKNLEPYKQTAKVSYCSFIFGIRATPKFITRFLLVLIVFTLSFQVIVCYALIYLILIYVCTLFDEQ